MRDLHNFLKNEENREKIIEATASDNINWHFIPPRAPHFGGIWEAGIKSVKTHLKRVIGNASLTYEELYTLLVQLEAMLNSRPLIPLSNHPDDLAILTPAHFLIGDSLLSNCQPDIKHIKYNRLSRFQYLEQLRQHFWSRWAKEYLSTLQQRPKWYKSFANVKLNDLVLVKEDNTAPLCWPRGRVIEVHPGADGVVRTVTIKTEKGTFKRPTRKLCLLPRQED